MIVFNGSRTVWKYRVPQMNVFTLQLPEGYQILDVQQQDDRAFLWVLVDPKTEPKPVKFVAFGTGYVPPDSTNAFDHVKTLQSRDHYGESVIVHLFREIHS